MSDLTVFTCNYSTPPADISNLEQSCKLNNINLQTYGAGKSWPGYAQGKIVGALEFVRQCTTPYVMFVDGRDSLILRNELYILNHYRDICTDGNVLISGELTCWPDASLAPLFGNQVGGWKYPNAGGWMGRRERVEFVLAHMVDGKFHNEWPEDDQRCWHELYKSTMMEYLTVDYRCRVFQTMSGHQHVATYCFNRETSTFPSVLHFNGRTPGIEKYLEYLTTYKRLERGHD